MNRLITLLFMIWSFNSFAQNVGVGINNPLAKLHVYSADSGVAIFQNAQSLAADISSGVFLKAGNYYTGAIKSIGSTFNTARLGFFTFSSTVPNQLAERMSILDNGLVGINTVTPTSPFTIKTATNVPGFEHTDGNRSIKSYINSAGANIGTDFGSFSLAAQGILFLTVLPNGLVGINNTTPLATLDVARGQGTNGTAEFEGTTNSSHFNYSTTEETYIRGGKATSQVIINDVSSGNVRIAEGGGNVGIGVAAPSAKLEVNGQVKIDGGAPAAGKVLTSTNGTGISTWENLPSYNTAFKVYSSGGVSIASYFFGTVLFNNSVSASGIFDDGNNFNNSTHAYVAPATGVYQFNISVSISSPTNLALQTGEISLEPIGSSSVTSNLSQNNIFVVAGAPLPDVINYSFITRMAAGDNIFIRVYHSTGGNITVGANANVFSGVRLY